MFNASFCRRIRTRGSRLSPSSSMKHHCRKLFINKMEDTMFDDGLKYCMKGTLDSPTIIVFYKVFWSQPGNLLMTCFL